MFGFLKKIFPGMPDIEECVPHLVKPSEKYDIKNIPSKEGLIYYKDNYYYSKSTILYGYSIGVTIKGKEEFDLELVEEKII